MLQQSALNPGYNPAYWDQVRRQLAQRRQMQLLAQLDQQQLLELMLRGMKVEERPVAQPVASPAPRVPQRVQPGQAIPQYFDDMKLLQEELRRQQTPRYR